MTFRSDLENLINVHSMEKGSDTPDFVLAQFLFACLMAFDSAARDREAWHERRVRAETQPESADDIA